MYVYRQEEITYVHPAIYTPFDFVLPSSSAPLYLVCALSSHVVAHHRSQKWAPNLGFFPCTGGTDVLAWVRDFISLLIIPFLQLTRSDHHTPPRGLRLCSQQANQGHDGVEHYVRLRLDRNVGRCDTAKPPIEIAPTRNSIRECSNENNAQHVHIVSLRTRGLWDLAGL